VQDPTSIKHFWMMQMLGNLGAEQNLYFMFSAPLHVQKTFPRYWTGTRGKCIFILKQKLTCAKMHLSTMKFGFIS